MKKVLKILKTIFVVLIVTATVGIMIFTIISVTTFDRNDRDLFGFKMFVVQTDSMSATDFSVGDIAISKEVDPSTLKEGDIITFISQNSASYGETITHKIRKVTKDEEGYPAFVTYGTTTNSDDEALVTYPYVVGKYVGKLPGVGSFFLFLKTTPGFIVCIFVPFLILILMQGVNFVRLFRRYKREQNEEIEEERQKIEQEKKESAEMLKELQALKAELAAQQAGKQSEAPKEEPAPEPAPASEAAPAAEESPAEAE